MRNTQTYTIEEIKTLDRLDAVEKFLIAVSAEMTLTYEADFDWRNFRFSPRHRLTVCWRGKEPVGLMLARLYPSVFDSKVKILYQDLLYAKSSTRAAKYLLDDFIDFGKSNANHLITMIAAKSNLKQRSLERLGFKKLETLYRLEV